MELLHGLFLGVSLSAACGFRVFVPPFMLSVAGLFWNMPLPTDLMWMASYPALLAFGTATGLELLGYSLPWIDNALDTVATPLAIIGGTLLAAGALGDAHPLVQWTLAVTLGGGAAGSVQTLTGLTRLTSTATTGGIANPFFAALENIGAFIMTLLSLLMPFVAVLLIGALVYKAFTGLQRVRKPARP